MSSLITIMEISVTPMGTGQVSVCDFVADLGRFLPKEGLPQQLTDMDNLREAASGRLLQVAGKLHELPFAQGIKRVVTRIDIDD